MAKQETKYIFVTGGVLSGLGKGITAASLGTILKARGLKINIQKCDPYLNTDAGTLNPAEHGEVFVTVDGAETDLDLGHYERFIDQELSASSSLMSGQIYARVINDERTGKYLGKTVQIIPHITGEIQRAIMATAEGFDIHIIEIGGTVGDYESLGFLEAIRQLKRRVGERNVIYVHLVYLPFIEASKELKSKPAQNAIRDLRETGIHPDVIIARAEHPIGQNMIDKLSLFGDVEPEGIIPLPTAQTVYEVPLILEKTGLGDYIVEKLKLKCKKPRLADWQKLINQIKGSAKGTVKIGVIAKYLSHEDTYISVFEAIKAAAWEQQYKAEIIWIDAEKINKKDGRKMLANVDGIIIPGGFGSRGIEGKILAADYAINHKLPYLGLCLGMQVAVIAYARKVFNNQEVGSTEADPDTKYSVIDIMEDQTKIETKGGTMRLGNYPCVLKDNSISKKAYGVKQVMERHRHRYEFNNKYREVLEKAGLRLAGLSPDNKLVEIIEVADHPFFVASQFHPEFKSRPNRPHPLFREFMISTIKNSLS